MLAVARLSTPSGLALSLVTNGRGLQMLVDDTLRAQFLKPRWGGGSTRKLDE